MEEFDHFPEIIEALHEGLKQAVKKTCLDIQAKAARNAPVDTGFLRSSIYVTGSFGSTYAEELEKSTRPSDKPTKSGKPRGLSKRQRAVKAKMNTDLLPEIATDPNDELTGYVAVGAAYGAYLEFGTRHMTARPYLYPAVEAMRGSFEDALSKIEARLNEVAR